MWGLDGSLNQENIRKLGQKWLKRIAILQDQELDEIGTWPNSWKCALHHWKVLQGSLTFHTYMTGQYHGKIPKYRGTFLLLGARHIITSLDMSNQQGHSHRGINHDTTLEVTNKHVFPKPTWFRRHEGWEKMSAVFRVFFKGVIFKNPLLVFLWGEWKVIFWDLLDVAYPPSNSCKWKVSKGTSSEHVIILASFVVVGLHLFNFGMSHQVDSNQKKLFVKRNPAISSSFQ